MRENAQCFIRFDTLSTRGSLTASFFLFHSYADPVNFLVSFRLLHDYDFAGFLVYNFDKFSKLTLLLQTIP